MYRCIATSIKSAPHLHQITESNTSNRTMKWGKMEVDLRHFAIYSGLNLTIFRLTFHNLFILNRLGNGEKHGVFQPKTYLVSNPRVLRMRL